MLLLSSNRPGFPASGGGGVSPGPGPGPPANFLFWPWIWPGIVTVFYQLISLKWTKSFPSNIFVISNIYKTCLIRCPIAGKVLQIRSKMANSQNFRLRLCGGQFGLGILHGWYRLWKTWKTQGKKFSRESSGNGSTPEKWKFCLQRARIAFKLSILTVGFTMAP